MGKIGDLWVKLGLKKDEYSRGMDEAGKEAEGLGGKMKNLKGVAVAAWAAIGAAVVKFAKDAISMTQKWGDSWKQTMDGIKGAYSAFVRQISSGEGWTNLFSNMREAYRVSKEISAALDEIFERKVSFSYQEADTEKKIAEQQLIMRDASKSEAERKAAAEEIIRLEDELGKTKKDIYADEAAALRDKMKNQAQLNDDELDFLVKEYNQNRAVIKQSRDYLKERARLQREANYAFGSTLSSGGQTAQDYAQAGQRKSDAQEALEKLERDTPKYIKDVAELTKKYDRANDELVKGMADAEVAVIRVDTETMHAQTRATALLGTLNNATSAAGESGAAQAQKILQRAEDSAKSEIRLLAEKYREEKALLEQYGLDTTALYEEYAQKIAKTLDVELPSMDQMADGLEQAPKTAEAFKEEAKKEIDILSDKYSEELAMLEDFGLDTTALTVRLLEDIEGIIGEWVGDLQPVEFEPLEITPPDLSEFDDFYKAYQERLEMTREIIEDFREAAVGGFSDAVQELTTQLTGLEDINTGRVFQTLLDPLADMAIKAGEIIMAEGLATIAAREALETFGEAGWGAVVAGAALVAAGAAAKAGLAALASSSGRSTATTSSASTGSAGNNLQTIQTEMTVYVTGRISGNDILLSGKKTQNSLNR